MRWTSRFLGVAAIVVTASLANLALVQGAPDPALKDAIVNEKGIEILKKGPIHEAFAVPGNLNGKPTPVVPKEPPPPVPEQPPEQKPEGDSAQWIPGYWAWDNSRNDFVWVSGLYRNMPPGRKYVPGYWTQSTEGWRWVPGFFASEQQGDVTYVPQPPATLDNGPSVPAPDDSSFYTQGTWVYNGTEFVWRPGFWSPYKAGYVWNDAAYQWTPGGYVFVPGYWDYPLANRGLLFPPVYFSSPLYQQPGYYYTPNYAMGLGGLLNNLYYSPNYPFYYYGGYGPGFAGLGFLPWFAGPAFRNPLFNYYRFANRHNPAWFNGVRQAFVNPANRGVAFAPLSQTGGLRAVSAGQRAAFQASGRQLQQLAVTRGQLERGLGNHGAVSTLRFSQGTLRATGPAAPASGFVNRTSSPAFHSARLAGSALPTNQHGLTGRPPAAAKPQSFGSLQGFHPGNSFQSASAFQPRSGMVGSPRNPTVSHSNNLGSIAAHSYGGTSAFRPSATSSFRPSVQTYRPSTITHMPSSSYRPSYGGGVHYGGAHYGGGAHMGGGHIGGGHMGGHGGGHGGHR